LSPKLTSYITDVSKNNLESPHPGEIKYGLKVRFYLYHWDPNGKGRILP